MGYGSYSVDDSRSRSHLMYSRASRQEIFSSRSMNEAMNPAHVIRECIDSEDHPETIPVIIGLDVTGSMGYVPEAFIKTEMSNMMEKLFQAGIKDAQILFIAIGDHECDRSPLQVGQFEANDQLMDKWLKETYLEGGGGGNAGESYLLAWKFAADHTKLSATGRGKKGFIFTIGDEPNLKSLPANAQSRIFGGNGQYKSETDMSLLKRAQENFHVFHLHLTETGSGSRQSVQDGWKQNLQDKCIILPSHTDIPSAIVEAVKKYNGQSGQIVMSENVPEVRTEEEEEMML